MVNERLASWLAPVVGVLIVPLGASAQIVSGPARLSGPMPAAGVPMIVGESDVIMSGPGVVLGGDSSFVPVGPVGLPHRSESMAETGEGERPKGTGDLIWPTLHERGWQALRSFVGTEEARVERLDTADTLFRSALEHLRPFQPGDERVAITYTDLAWVFFLRERYDDAKQLANWALQERLARHGPYSPRTADSLILMSKIAKAQGQYEEAEKFARRALAAYTRSSPGSELDFHTPIALDALGEVYMAQSRLELAEAYIRRALEWRQEMVNMAFFLPEKDPMAYSERARSYLLLATVLDKLGRTEEAQILRESAQLDLESAFYGPAGGGGGAGGGAGGPAPAPPF